MVFNIEKEKIDQGDIIKSHLFVLMLQKFLVNLSYLEKNYFLFSPSCIAVLVFKFQ